MTLTRLWVVHIVRTIAAKNYAHLKARIGTCPEKM